MSEMETAESIMSRHKAIQARLWGNLYPPVPRERVFRPVEAPPEPLKGRQVYIAPIGPDMSPTTPKDALRWIARKHEISVEDILGTSKRTVMVAARRDVIIWIDENWRPPLTRRRWSMSEIAKFINRDHSTISHALGRNGTRRPIRGVFTMEKTEYERQLESGAAALRAHEMIGRNVHPWESLKPCQKEKWLAKADVVLKASSGIKR